jgi:hypothetical protein
MIPLRESAREVFGLVWGSIQFVHLAINVIDRRAFQSTDVCPS